ACVGWSRRGPRNQGWGVAGVVRRPRGRSNFRPVETGVARAAGGGRGAARRSDRERPSGVLVL
ncbi:MAG: hypothetical protein AVDCRST_MAG59-2599, partial [uncultured Thermomicrobiales bacterium]